MRTLPARVFPFHSFPVLSSQQYLLVHNLRARLDWMDSRWMQTLCEKFHLSAKPPCRHLSTRPQIPRRGSLGCGRSRSRAGFCPHLSPFVPGRSRWGCWILQWISPWERDGVLPLKSSNTCLPCTTKVPPLHSWPYIL